MSGAIRLNGSTSGYVELAAPAVAGSTVLELPTDSIKPGLTLVTSASFSAQSAVSVDSCFTSTYENYRIVYNGVGSGSNVVTGLRLRASSADNSTSNYSQRGVHSNTAGSAGAYNLSAATYFEVMYSDSTTPSSVVCDVLAPQLSRATLMSNMGLGYNSGLQAVMVMYSFGATTQFDGFTIYPDSGTITGSLYVYGYRKA